MTCVNSRSTAWQGNGMDAAWARHVMCELAFIFPISSLTLRSPFHPSEFTAIKPSSVGFFTNFPSGYFQGK
jgi:hypothetical protein